MRLQQIIDRLQAAHGSPVPPKVTDPLGMILFENIAYLVSDSRRDAAFEALSDLVGTTPEQILSAPRNVLLTVAKLGGMHPEQRVEKLLRIAQIALKECQGDLKKIIGRPLAQAKKVLKLFPGIGDPGAEKILLFSQSHPILALESNGLRVLVRIGFGQEQKSYAATYRSVRGAVENQVKKDFIWLIRAHQLLRRHGQQICQRSYPVCKACPLTNVCLFYRERAAG